MKKELQYEIPSIASAENELREIKKDLEKVTFSPYVEVIPISSTHSTEEILNNSSNNTYNPVFDLEYDFARGQPINHLELIIGSNIIPRHSCACHKLNLVVRHAITRHFPLCQILRELNQSNSHVRKSIELTRVFSDKKCRLRLENLTRWSSAYLMLESVQKAYKKGFLFILFDSIGHKYFCI